MQPRYSRDIAEIRPRYSRDTVVLRHYQGTLVGEEVAAAGGDPTTILLLYGTHTLNNAVHNAAWFIVCELEGGVSTGLLMGVKAAAAFLAPINQVRIGDTSSTNRRFIKCQAAALFLASAAFFCDEEHREQASSNLPHH